MEMFPKRPLDASCATVTSHETKKESKIDRLFTRVRNTMNKPPIAIAEPHKQQENSPAATREQAQETGPFSLSKVIFSAPVGPKLRYFPLAEGHITSDHRSRFEYVVKEYLMISFEDDEELNLWPVAFKLIMAGSCSEDARPTIVISAPRGLKKRVRQIIEEPHMVEQCDPPFQVLCLGSDRLFGLVTDDVDILFEQGLSLCACPVFRHSPDDQRQQVCMISCLLAINGKPYALTAGHPFGVLDGRWDLEGAPDADDSETDIDPSDSEADAAENSNFRDVQLRYPDIAQSCRVSYLSRGTHQARDSSQSGTDWALLELDPMIRWKANRYLENKLSPFKGIPPAEQGLRAVTVMTSPYTEPLRGYICFRPPVITYHWDQSKRAFELWTVTLSGKISECQSTFVTPICQWMRQRLTETAFILALTQGNSGALIIDSETHLVYGYVIAVSPLGDLYVVPLDRTMQHISEVVGTDDVVFMTDGLLPTKTPLDNGPGHLETKMQRISNIPSGDSLKYATDDKDSLLKALAKPLVGKVGIIPTRQHTLSS